MMRWTTRRTRRSWARPSATTSAKARSRCRCCWPISAGDAAERDFWQRTIEAIEQTEADLDRALHLMERCHAIRTTLDRARGFVHAAKSSLAPFPDNAFRRALLDVADYTVSRAR